MAMHKKLKFGIEMAKEAGKILKKHFYLNKKIEFKSEKNPVTEVDKTIDALIAKRIKKEFPEDAILSEELASNTKESEKMWIVDPIDGTLNFIHRLPQTAISIAYIEDGELILGIVYNPITEEMFYGEKDKGAFLNGKRISVSNIKSLKNSLLATGMQPIFEEFDIECYRNFNKAANAIRRWGSAALDLSFIACGRFDGCFEIALKPWDIAAGILILQEAGGKTTGFDGKKLEYLKNGTILASNGKIHNQMLKIIKF